MKRVGHVFKRLAVPLCLVCCAAVLAWGAASLAASARELGVSFLALQGQTEGIGRLDIFGNVMDGGSGLVYTFDTGAAAGPKVRLYPWDISHTLPFGHWPFDSVPGITLKAAAGVREEILPEDAFENSQYGDYWHRRRVYADVYEAVPLLPYGDITARLSPEDEKLYWDGAPGTHIAYAGPLGEESDTAEYYPFVHLGDYRRFAIGLKSQVQIGDTWYFVPSVEGLYGRTAVYSIQVPEGGMVFGEEMDYPAREVYPIRLSKGEDEICGFVQGEDTRTLLLAVRHGDQMELVRLLPEPLGGVYPSVTIPAHLELREPVANGRWLLFSHIGEQGRADYRVVDTADMSLAAKGDGVPLAGAMEEGELKGLEKLWAFCLEEETLYIGSEAMVSRIPYYDYRARLYITALTLQGDCVGSGLLCMGIEADPNMPHNSENNYFRDARRLTLLTLEGGKRP